MWKRLENSARGNLFRAMWPSVLPRTFKLAARQPQSALSSGRRGQQAGQRARSARTASAARRPLRMAPLIEALSRWSPVT